MNGWCFCWQRSFAPAYAPIAAMACNCAKACVMSLQAATMRQWSASMQNTCTLYCPVLSSCPSFDTSRSASGFHFRNNGAHLLAKCRAEVVSGWAASCLLRANGLLTSLLLVSTLATSFNLLC